MDDIKIPIYRLTRTKRFIVRYWFTVSAASIVIFAALLRFYNYGNRWGLAYDQAHDVLVARYALEASKIPLVGPFSSAGPFQTGGEWYWFLMAATAIHKDSVLTPWIVLTLLYVGFVYCMVLLGKELAGKAFGVILGILSSVSTAQIAQSVNLTNQSPLAILALMAIWSVVRYVKRRASKYLFFLGLSVSLAATTHLQGVSLILLILATVVFAGFPNKRAMVFLFLGIILPLIPLAIFDINSNFVNGKGMLQYYLHDQYKISFDVLGRRWLTYVGVFWPNAWAHIIGGKALFAHLSIASIAAVVLYTFFKRKISKEWYILITSFIGMVILIRYIRIPLFDSYIVFLHPFVFLLTGWAIFVIFQWRKIIGIFILTLIVSASIYKDISDIKAGENYTAIETNQRVHVLFEQFPNQKFAIYAYKYKWADKNVALSLFLEVDKKIDSSGRRIGIVIATKSGEFKYPILEGKEEGYQLLDLESSTSAQLSDSGWVLVNSEEIYRSTQEWYSRENR